MRKIAIIKSFPYLFFVALICIGYVPYFSAMDKMATQFLALTVLNITSFLYLLFLNKSYIKTIGDSIKNRYLILFFLFILISFSGYFFALNKAEVILNSTKMLTYFLTLFLSFIFISRIRNPINFFVLIIFLCLIVDNVWVLIRFIERFEPNRSSRDMGLRAFSGNINITAFVILFKAVISMFLLDNKNRLLRTLSILILSISFFNIFLMGSRGANISILLVTIAVIFFHFNFFSKKLLINYLISLTIGVIINQSFFFKSDDYSAFNRSIKINNASTNQRLRFYDHALQSISEHPLFGVGSGNWKLESIKYDKFYMYNYTVPYHVHNDFLEVSTEVGLLGSIFFFSVYIFLAFGFIKLLRNKNKIFPMEKRSFLMILYFFVGVFTVDLSLNFPIARPVEFVFFILIVVLMFSELKPKILKINKKLNAKFNRLTLSFLFSFSIFSIYPNYKNYQSFVDQNFLVVAARGDNYEYSEDYVYQYDSRMPNLTATTIPIEALKANLIFNIKVQKDTLLYLIDKGIKANPYIGFPEVIKALYFIREKNIDSAYTYSKKAFYKLPGHETHFNLLLDLIEVKNDTIELEKAYSYFKKPVREDFSKMYLSFSTRMKSDLGISEKNIVKQLSMSNPNDESIFIYKIIDEVGKKNVEDAYYLQLQAEFKYDKELYNEAGELYERAFKINPKENSYYENAANSYMKAGKINYAINILEEYIPKNNPTSGKAEYLLGIMKISIKDYQSGCEDLYLSREKGFSIPDVLFEKFCKKNN